MSGITARDLAHLKAASARARAGALSKLVSSPVRLGYSKILEKWCQGRRSVSFRRARTFWGESMSVAFPDPISVSIYRYGYFEEDLIRTFVEVVRPGSTVFDVGAHSLLALRLVGPTGRLIAFEPTPGSRRILELNIGGRPNATIVPMAAYREETTLTFHDFGVQFSGYNSIYTGKLDDRQRQAAQAASVSVEAIRLDTFVERTGHVPGFVKVDTEGAELDVLAGMDGLLSGRFGARPALTLEVDSVAGQGMRRSSEVVSAILARGYRGFEFGASGCVELVPREEYRYASLLFKPM
jgi:FkbM family methyltransferase